MDPLTHLVITRACVGRQRTAIIAGVVPDIPFYATYPLWVLRHGQLPAVLAKSAWPNPPPSILRLHHATHSVPIALFAAWIIQNLTGRWPVRALNAWLLHILIDIPTHTRDPWGPRPFWPFSDMAFDGVGWAEIATACIVSCMRSWPRFPRQITVQAMGRGREPSA
jgi:hypothetical protein